MGKRKLKRGAAQKAKREVSLPQTPWDHGPDTQAARHLTVVEKATDINPDTGKDRNVNGVTRRRRLCWAENLSKQGHLTERQCAAAKRLREVWEVTQKGPPSAFTKVQVDTFANPSANALIHAGRVSQFHNVARYVPTYARPVINHVVLENQPIRSGAFRKGWKQHLERLQKGLDALANALHL